MYENLTPEYIKSDMLEEFTLADTREGSYTNTLVSPVAKAMWKVYTALNAVLPIVFVDETSGPYIDKNAEQFGIKRKQGTKATAKVLFQGEDGTVIPAGKVFLTIDSYEYTLDETVTIAGGTAAGILTAADVGEAYNAPAGAIFRQITNLGGITAVESEAAKGGTDSESDAAYVKRFNDFRRRPATSGNVAHYMNWAQEVDGAGKAKVIPLWAGPGTVKVLIAGEHNQPVDHMIVEKVADHIEEVRPIGATVTVVSVIGVDIDVVAAVIIKPSTTLNAVIDAFSAALSAYLASITLNDYLIVYNRVGYILLDIPGVVDFTSLLVNGGTSDIVLDEDEVPVVGNVEVA